MNKKFVYQVRNNKKVSFYYSNKKYDKGGKTSQPVLIYKTVVVTFFFEVLSWLPWTDKINHRMCVRKASPQAMT